MLNTLPKYIPMRNETFVYRNLLIIILLSLLNACSPPEGKIMVKDGKAYFEYFSYSGNDAFFNENPLAEGQFYNPILSGFFPDPSICKKDDDYYIVNSTFSFFPGIPVFHSNDLVNWKQIGHVLDRPSQFENVDQPVSWGIFAPAITYNPYNDLFYLTTTYVGGGGNFVVTAKDPAGPWSDPVWLPEVPGIDPSLFFDDNGKAYIMNNHDPEGGSLYQGHKAIWLQEFDVNTNTTFGPRKMIRNGGHNLADKPIWIEGPHIYKLNGYYYLMTAEGGTSIYHSQVIFRSKNIWGPYQTYEGNPILTQRDLDKYRPNPITNTGHADLIQDKNGDWYAIFLACRPYTPENIFNIGRETFLLPVTWNEEGWPIILERGLEVPMILDLPKGVVSREHEDGFMKRGNFSFIEDFKSSQLPLEWFFLRTPTETWHEFDTSRGGVTINARPINLRERKHPSFMGTRQRHHNFEAETAMHYLPSSNTDLAGLVMFQNEAFHFVLGVSNINGKNFVTLQKSSRVNDKVDKEILAQQELTNGFKGKIHLKVQCSGGKFSFFYKVKGNDWNLLASDIDASYLSTERAGGFIGTILGFYASSND